jgi:hypothetical protein
MLKFLLTLVLLVFAAIGVGAVALLVLDDDDDSDGTANTGAPPPVSSGPNSSDADTLLQEASAAASEVSSFHFVLTHENGSTPLPLNLALESAEGDIGVPDSLSAHVEAEAVGINVEVDIIGIDGRTWLTNPFTRNWEELPDTNIRDFADPAALVSGLLPSIQGAQVSDGQELDGVATRLVTGSITTDALREALGTAEPGRTVQIEAWIGADDRLPRRVRVTGALTAEEEPNVVRQVDISRYDQPVEIMPPE